MGEGEFLDRIDCRFPYSDREGALELAAEAMAISPNAAFAVVYEVCYVPDGVHADIETRHEVLARIEKSLPHPLRAVILPVARDVVDGGRLAAAERIALMRKVAPFRDQYAALQIALHARDPDEPEDEEPDRVYDEILASWSR